MNVRKLPEDTFLYKHGFVYGICLENDNTMLWKINLALQKFYGNGFVYSWFTNLKTYENGISELPVVPEDARWGITQMDPETLNKPSWVGVREESDLTFPLIYATTNTDWESTLKSMSLTDPQATSTIASIEMMIELRRQK